MFQLPFFYWEEKPLTGSTWGWGRLLIVCHSLAFGVKARCLCLPGPCEALGSTCSGLWPPPCLCPSGHTRHAHAHDLPSGSTWPDPAVSSRSGRGRADTGLQAALRCQLFPWLVESRSFSCLRGYMCHSVWGRGPASSEDPPLSPGLS